jgi:hypothetical protein
LDSETSVKPRPDEPVLDHLLVVGVVDVEGLVVDRALAEGPRALRELGLLDELEDAPVALVGADRELVVLALRAGLRAAHALGDEEGLQLGLAHRARRAVGAADATSAVTPWAS